MEMDSAQNQFNKRARLFEDPQDKDAKVIYPSNPGSTEPVNKGYGGSTAIQSFFKESKAEETPKVLKKRGRKKKNPNPGKFPRETLNYVLTFVQRRVKRFIVLVCAEEVNSSTPGGDDSENRSKFYESASARKRTVTAEERERAVNAAKTFEPTNPYFRVVLRPSYLYRGCIMVKHFLEIIIKVQDWGEHDLFSNTCSFLFFVFSTVLAIWVC